MIDWSAIQAPAPPPGRELVPAFMLGGGLAVSLMLVPSHALSPVHNGLPLAVAGLILLPMAVLLRGWLGVVMASVVVVGGFEASLKLESFLPGELRAAGIYRLSDVASCLFFCGKRVGMLAPAVVLAAFVCLVRPNARTQFREAVSFGTWSGGIRWPLPWWGVPTMPLWLFFAIALPLLITGFLPLIDWDATTTRWGTLSPGVWALVPVLALLNATLEELVFRAGLLSLFSEVLTVEAAAIPVALAFGFVHFSGGVPDGLLGAVLLSFGSFFLGYFVLIQRGLSGAILWHAAADVIVLSFVLQ